MVIKKELIIVLIALLSTTLPAMAQENPPTAVNKTRSHGGFVNINWENLNLTEDQIKKVKMLDLEWQQVKQLIRPKIVRDQQQLKNVLSNPNFDEDQIRKLQRDIMLRQEQLRFEATENFLSKRRILTNQQKELLRQMMPR